MRLHEDTEAFKTLLEIICEKTNYRMDVIEKDYYVCLLLEELSLKQKQGLKAYFKGGTALYKALGLTNRFSEDIDLTVDTRNLNRTQNEKMLAEAAKKYSSLKRDPLDGFSHRQEVVSIYSYIPISNYDKDDTLQRFGKVKIEATSFTISEPYSYLEIIPLLYLLATEEQKQVLKSKYEVKPFNVLTSSIERIFIDKLFAAESYTKKSENKDKAFEVAKHIYDLSVIYHSGKVHNLLKDEKLMKYILDIRIEEELNRLDGIPGELPSDFVFFDNLLSNIDVKRAYETMQRQYIFMDKDRKEYNMVVNDLLDIKKQLQDNKSWSNYTK